MQNMKTKLLKYGISAAVGVALALIIMIAKGAFTEDSTVQLMSILCDSFFVPGVVLTCAGLLVFVSNGGVFDMLAYAFILIGYTFKRDISKRKYHSYYEYKESKKDRKKGMGFLLIVGIIFIVISVCFLIPFYALQQPGMQ